MPLTIASLFSGIGGIERGLEQAGHHAVFQCEILDTAREVLRSRFPDSALKADLTELRSLPNADIITAGFPCQNLSQAGKMEGISGRKSSLVNNLFDLLEKKSKKQFPQWLMLENVPFMLQLQRGAAMRHVTKRLDQLNMKWAYRVVDARAFGLPQRRRRVVLLASREHNPKAVLFGDDAREQIDFDVESDAYGFYWTEGNTGLGWTVDGVPTLKGGSGLGIPCPPAIWLVNSNAIVTPDIRDAERLQGFPANWTKPAMAATKRIGNRWKLIGNAVPVPISRWVGRRLENPGSYDTHANVELKDGAKWPCAAWGESGSVFEADVTEWPKCFSYRSLSDFLKFTPKPLSLKATSGFFGRLQSSRLRRPVEFDEALAHHIKLLRKNARELAAT